MIKISKMLNANIIKRLCIILFSILMIVLLGTDISIEKCYKFNNSNISKDGIFYDLISNKHCVYKSVYDQYLAEKDGKPVNTLRIKLTIPGINKILAITFSTYLVYFILAKSKKTV